MDSGPSLCYCKLNETIIITILLLLKGGMHEKRNF